MPLPRLTFRNTLIVVLTAWACILFPSSLGTDKLTVSTGAARTITSLYHYLGAPERYRGFGAAYRRQIPNAAFPTEEQQQTTANYMIWPFNIISPKTTVADSIVRNVATMAKQRTPVGIPVYTLCPTPTNPANTAI